MIVTMQLSISASVLEELWFSEITVGSTGLKMACALVGISGDICPDPQHSFLYNVLLGHLLHMDSSTQSLSLGVHYFHKQIYTNSWLV
jgi:hypothetical protein